MRKTFNLIVALAIVCLSASCNKDSEGPTDFSGGCEAVDLGLSVKWASYNVGAQNVENLGFYFAWGETTEKTNYDWSAEGDYKWGTYNFDDKPFYGMTKYTGDSIVGGDGLKTLLTIDDPATVNWGTKWRTPTVDEINELLDSTKCKWTWDEVRRGFTVTGLKTGNSIFLPAAGYRNGTGTFLVGVECLYWSSSVYQTDPSHAYYLTSFWLDWSAGIRSDGLSVRAVTEY